MGRLWGWCLTSFIFGIAFHTAVRRFSVSMFIWVFVFTVGAFAISTISSKHVRVVTCIFLAFCVGVWRVDVSKQPTLRYIDGRAFVIRTQVDDVWSVYRKRLTQRISSSFSPDQTALIAGVLYGDAEFSKEAKERFVSSGLMHIVVVSGSNVTILIHAITFFLVLVGLRRRYIFLLSSVSIVLFSLFVGAEPSVLRAMIMALAVLLSREFGRPTSSFRILLFTAAVLIAWEPWQLLYNASFALSFLAMWGVIAWTPFFTKQFSFLPNVWGIREIAAMTCSATLMTTPYIAWAFERITFLGLITNFFALPLVPFVMAGGFCVAILGATPITAFISIPTQGFVELVYLSSRLGEYLPWLNRNVIGMSSGVLVATYLLIVYLWIKIGKPVQSEDEDCGLLHAFFGRVSVR